MADIAAGRVMGLHIALNAPFRESDIKKLPDRTDGVNECIRQCLSLPNIHHNKRPGHGKYIKHFRNK
jgi:hypothetical protein